MTKSIIIHISDTGKFRKLLLYDTGKFRRAENEIPMQQSLKSANTSGRDKDTTKLNEIVQDRYEDKFLSSSCNKFPRSLA